MIPITQLKHRDEFGGWLNGVGLDGVGIEVGTFYGEYAETILRSWNGETLYCIDPWERQAEYNEAINEADWGEVYKAAFYRAIQFDGRMELMRGYSVNEVEGFTDNYNDFVYIDAKHDYESIKEDLRLWWPKVKPGGVFCGHDFYQDAKSQVQQAVREFALEKGLIIHTTPCTSWWTIKTAADPVEIDAI
jgi:predicted O-methyltransferase YrrM